MSSASRRHSSSCSATNAPAGQSVAFGLVNAQTQHGNVTATAGGLDGGALDILVGGTDQVADLVDSKAFNLRNALVAAAYGNEASSTEVLSLGSLVSDDPVVDGTRNLATLISAQEGDSAITAGIEGGQLIRTVVGNNVFSSELTVGGNSLGALAYGNRVAGNALTVTATDITTVPNASGQPSAYSTISSILPAVSARPSGAATMPRQSARRSARMSRTRRSC